MLIMVAISMTVIVVATALTVDLGRVSTRRRDLQNVADAAALDLVRLVDGRTAGEITTDARWDATKQASLARNDFVPGGDRTVTVQLGSYDTAAEVFTPVAGAASIPSAVLVEVGDRVTYEFAPGGVTASRRAVAANEASAGVQVGSFAARLDSSQSALLGSLLGDAIGVDLVGYEGLAAAQVGLAALATELDLSVASPNELLATELTLGELVLAQADVLRAAGDLVNADLLEALAADLANPDVPIALGDLLTIVTGGTTAAADASLNVLELLTAAALVANGDAFLDLPALALGVPGVADLGTRVQVIERPRWAFGGPGTTVETSQVRLETTLGLTAPGLVGVTLAVSVDASNASATIRDLTCGTPKILSIDATTGLLATALDLSGQVAVQVPPLPLLTVADVTATASAGQQPEGSTVEFVLPPDAIGVAKPYSSRSLSLSDLTVDVQTQLLPDLGIVGALLGLVTGAVDEVVALTLEPLLQSVLAALDTVLVQPLLSLLGVTLPGADVTPLALRCKGADLVA